MTSRSAVLICCLVVSLSIAPVYAEKKAEKNPDSNVDQQINDFSLAGYGERGKKTWDISGKSADIFDDVIKLNDITGNMYGEQENVNLVADKGEFNKAQAKVHLEKNVVITTTSGAKMTTDSLDWDRKNQIVSTKDPVNIAKDNMVTTGVGINGSPALKKVTLEKDVQVDILPVNKDAKEGSQTNADNKVVINCDGPLVIDYDKNIATFNNNVKVDRNSTQIYSDSMDVYFTTASKNKDNDKDKTKADSGSDAMGMPSGMEGSKVEKIVARDNVRIVRGENVSYSDEATYIVPEKKIILSGKPRLVISSTEGLSNASAGN